MLNVLNIDLEGIDDRLYLSVPGVSDAIVAEVKLHGLNQIVEIIKERS